MRPHKLTLSAFGPYAGEQVIDFDQLDGRNLFLITGPTGAGKTTIFDAICFALFGKASSAERESVALRSHFAANDVETFVELEFSLGGKHYWVKRSPWQLRSKRRGSGTTASDHDAEFKELTAGSVTLSKPAAVDPKIVETLGLSYEQFRQIVMVPQGEFRRLITAGTREREDIFRKIFGTEQFLLIQNKLFDKAKLLEQELKNLQGQLEQTIRRIDPASDAEMAQLLVSPSYDVSGILVGLETLLAQDATRSAALKNELEKMAGVIQSKQKELFQAEEIQRKFATRAAAAAEKMRLENRQAEIGCKKEKMEQAGKAATVRLAEENCQDWVQREKNKLSKLEEAEKNKLIVLRQTATAEEQLEAERRRDPERAAKQAEQTRLEGMGGKVAEMETRRGNLTDVSQKAQQAEQALSGNQQKLDSQKKGLLSCQTELELAQASSSEVLIRQRELENAETSEGTLAKLAAARKRWLELDVQTQAADRRFDAATKVRVQAETACESGRAIFLQQQVAYLASNLQQGQPCLVCGSVNHPRPAASSANSPSEAELKLLEQNVKAAQSDCEKCRQEVEQLSGERQKQQVTGEVLREGLEPGLKQAYDRVAAEKRGSWLRETLSGLQTQLGTIRQELTRLQQLKQRQQQLESGIADRKIAITQLEQQAQSLADQRSELLVSVKTEQEILRQLEVELPESVRSQQALSAAMQKNQAEKQALKSAMERAEQAVLTGKLKRAQAEAATDAAQAARNDAGIECNRARDKFFAAMSEAGFADVEVYAGVKLDASAVLQLQTEITDYFEQLRSAGDNYERSQKELAGVALVDSAPLQQQLNALQTETDSLNQQAAELFARQKNNRENLNQINGLKNIFDKNTAQYSLVSDLAKVARGDNSQRMSFERYILAAYFDDIVAAANLRLVKMTAGRYEMRRIDEKGKGGGQFGLELEVLDYYTGKYRHVKTLSGGEGFKASLALALGLADVVQAYAGGVNVDTMFVDEGFGTLDPESLQSAISCLIDLQRSGRLVGIISHVPELKEEIDARLEIEAGSAGSLARFVIA